MTEYRQEKLADTISEIAALVPQQWAEMAQGFEEFVSDTNWAVYLKAEEMGAGVLFTARDDGRLIGYFGMLVHPHLSMKSEIAATSTPYYVIPCRTRGLILRRLFGMGLAEARLRGATMAAIRTHTWASCAPILEAMKFREIETSYMLKLSPPGVSVSTGDEPCLTSASGKV